MEKTIDPISTDQTYTTNGNIQQLHCEGHITISYCAEDNLVLPKSLYDSVINTGMVEADGAEFDICHLQLNEIFTHILLELNVHPAQLKLQGEANHGK